MQRQVDVDELHPGVVLAEPVRSDDSTLYHKGRKLSLEDIVLLQNWRISSVKVESWSQRSKQTSH